MKSLNFSKLAASENVVMLDGEDLYREKALALTETGADSDSDEESRPHNRMQLFQVSSRASANPSLSLSPLHISSSEALLTRASKIPLKFSHQPHAGCKDLSPALIQSLPSLDFPPSLSCPSESSFHLGWLIDVIEARLPKWSSLLA